jgi:hypothetical protein
LEVLDDVRRDPANDVLSRTSRVTTALAATTAFSPMVTPGMTDTGAPSQTPCLMTMGAHQVERRRAGSSG